MDPENNEVEDLKTHGDDAAVFLAAVSVLVLIVVCLAVYFEAFGIASVVLLAVGGMIVSSWIKVTGVRKGK